MNKKEIKDYLVAFSEAIGVKVQDKKEYIFSSDFGNIKVSFRLEGGLPSVFTRLLSNEYGFNIFKDFAAYGYNSNTGKNNYYGEGEIYSFLHTILITHNIVKSKDAMSAKIEQSMFDKTGKNKMFDLSIYKGGVLDDCVVCISYMEATQTALNLKAEVLRTA